MPPEKISVVARRSRFEPTTRDSVAVNLTSPTVFQGLMQVLANQDKKMDTLARKIDALATRSPHEVTAPLAQPNVKALPKPESRKALPSNKKPPAKKKAKGSPATKAAAKKKPGGPKGKTESVK